MSGGRDEKINAVLAAEQAWVAAHRELNPRTLAALMAEEYKSIQPDGSVIDKAAELASYQSGDRFWEFAESDEYQVEMLGDTAVLIGRWRAKGINAGVRFNYAARFMAIYVQREGHWQIFAAQSTPIPGQTSGGSLLEE